jgi:hypothetical protein
VQPFSDFINRTPKIVFSSTARTNSGLSSLRTWQAAATVGRAGTVKTRVILGLNSQSGGRSDDDVVNVDAIERQVVHDQSCRRPLSFGRSPANLGLTSAP